MLGSRLWSELTQRQVATGSVPSSGGSGDGTGSGGSSQEINTLKTEIADIKANLKNIYTKEEADTLISDITSNIGDGYTKEEADNLINEIKARLDNVYTKAESESLVATEAAKLVGDAPENLDTIKEIVDWIDVHRESATEMNTAIADNKSNITNLQKSQSSKMDTDDIRIISQADYDALPEDQKTAEFYVITDGPVE